MKKRHLITISIEMAVAAILSPANLHAQGQLTPPPGAVAPTQKSLQEIWDKLSAQELKIDALSEQNSQLLKNLEVLFSSLFKWNTETIDSPSGDESTSLAFDANGLPAISYYDTSAVANGVTQLILKFARHNGVNWTIETVDNALGENFLIGRYTSLAFGADGHPAISYYDPAHGTLKFARYDGASWTLEGLDTGTSDAEAIGLHNSLAFGADGHPAISYYDDDFSALKFARYDGASWTLQTLDSADDVGEYTSLAFGADGHPAISYYDASHGTLKFARYDGASWTLEDLDTGNSDADEFGLYTSLAFGADGHPAISYYAKLRSAGQDTTENLKFARYGGASWTLQTLDSAGDVGLHTSLAFGENGNPAISYYRADQGTLKFARHNGASWTFENRDTGNSDADKVGLYTSLAFGADGQPAISYYDQANGDLKFTRFGAAP